MALLVYTGGTSINVGIIMKLFGTLIKSGSMRKSLGMLLIASSLILCIVIAGCTQAQTLPAPTAKPTAVPTTVVPINGCDMNAQDKASMAFMNNTNLRNVSFCEIIVWCGDGGTYNTMSLNAKGDSCPEALFLGLNKTESGNPVPRYRVLVRIPILAASSGLPMSLMQFSQQQYAISTV